MAVKTWPSARKLPKGALKVEVDGFEWAYLVGKLNIVIFSPWLKYGVYKKWVIPKHEIEGFGKDKMRAFILSNLIKE